MLCQCMKYSHITPVGKTHQWLPVEHHSVFKTAPYWCTSSNKVAIPNVLNLFLNLDKVFIVLSHRNQGDGVLLLVLHFASSVYKTTRHFVLSFAYDVFA